MHNGFRPALAGLLAGFAVALAIAHAMRSVLFEMPPTDPLTYFAVAATFTVTAFIAIIGPAWRVAQSDPLRSIQRQ